MATIHLLVCREDMKKALWCVQLLRYEKDLFYNQLTFLVQPHQHHPKLDSSSPKKISENLSGCITFFPLDILHVRGGQIVLGLGEFRNCPSQKIISDSLI